MRDENVYELLYMRRQKDEYASKEIFKSYEGLLIYLVNFALEARPCFRHYRDDIVQEAWITFAHGLEIYREDKNASFKTFICLIIKRKIQQLFRNYTRSDPEFHGQVIALDDEYSYLLSTHQLLGDEDGLMNPEYYTYYRLAEDKVNQTIASLSVAERNALECWLDGDSYREASKKLGITEKSYGFYKLKVKKKIHEALE